MSENTLTVTDDMVAEALDAKATMSQLHCFLYATEKCRCGEEWTDAHWMRFILERALSRVIAEEPEWGCRSRAHIMAGRDRGAIVLVDAHEAAEHDCPSPAIVYRRKAGPWIYPVVNQEEETE